MTKIQHLVLSKNMTWQPFPTIQRNPLDTTKSHKGTEAFESVGITEKVDAGRSGVIQEFLSRRNPRKTFTPRRYSSSAIHSQQFRISSVSPDSCSSQPSEDIENAFDKCSLASWTHQGTKPMPQQPMPCGQGGKQTIPSHVGRNRKALRGQCPCAKPIPED